MRDALKIKDPEKAAKFITQTYKKIEEISDQVESRGKGVGQKQTPALQSVTKLAEKADRPATQSSPVKAKPAPVEVGQWMAQDPANNVYIMIKYSDGTKRYVFASIYGQQEISDPGPKDWRRVR